jgi:uncharacterized protein (DUF2236 family)
MILKLSNSARSMWSACIATAVMIAVVQEQYFDDTSVLRRVHREHVVALSGARALLMQAAHPVAFAGFFMSTGALGDPYARLQRTARVIDLIIWGSRADADAATAAVRRVHATKRGTLPETVGIFEAGTPWAADDPALLLWIIATLADSAWVVYERYVEPLSRADKDAYWRDMTILGELFGLHHEEMPQTSLALERYVQEMLDGDVLFVSDQARELGTQIVLHPPVPLLAKPLLELANFITVGLLPSRIRRQYRLGWDPLRAVTLRVGAQYTRRLLIPLLPGRVRYRPDRISRGAPAPGPV